MKRGVEIKSIDEGYISRISISLSGFEKLFILLIPMGSHLFMLISVGLMDKYVKTTAVFHYQKSFVINRFFKKDEFAASKDEVIGYSGNTGSSFGPHLHFEIRKSSENLPINPLRFGYPIEDTIRQQLEDYFHKIEISLIKEKRLILKEFHQIHSKVNQSNQTVDLVLV